MNTLTLPIPDDFHLHLRDGSALKRTVADASYQLGRGLIMPNLIPAIDTVEALSAYKERIMAEIPENQAFQPLMTFYLSTNLTVETIKRAKSVGAVAVKWYPKGATTNSAQGVADYQALYPILAEMENQGLLLLIHGEVTDPEIDIFARESAFLSRILTPIRRDFPNLKIVMEHITTAEAVEFIQNADKNLAGTVTAHHLLATRNDLLVGGIKPHFYCLPILKTETDRQALLKAVTSGDPRFFMGTDSAPHAQDKKENACGCAGCYTAPFSLELYATAFESVGKLDKLADFVAKFGADYYGLPYNQGTITLQRTAQVIPEALPYESAQVIPFWAGKTLNWTFIGKNGVTNG